MSVCIDINKINKIALFNETLKLYPNAKRSDLAKIFNYFMTDCGEFYILLNNEYYEAVNPNFNLIYAIDAKYGYKDWHSKVLLNNYVNHSLNKQIYHEHYEIDEEFDVESNERGDW